MSGSDTTTVLSPWMISPCRITYFLIIKWARLEEDVSVQILYFTKSLPPGFIHPLTNRMAFWINLTAGSSYLVPRKYKWVKITPSCFNPINISNNCIEELDNWRRKHRYCVFIYKKKKKRAEIAQNTFGCFGWHLALVPLKFECTYSKSVLRKAPAKWT